MPKCFRVHAICELVGLQCSMHDTGTAADGNPCNKDEAAYEKKLFLCPVLASSSSLICCKMRPSLFASFLSKLSTSTAFGFPLKPR